jgi:hypothetical protein
MRVNSGSENKRSFSGELSRRQRRGHHQRRHRQGLPDYFGDGGNSLTGNAPGNVLVGGTAVDTIVVGTGLSVLIDGRGADNVTGGFGGDCSLAGSPTSTPTTRALMSILAEWQSGNSYAARISHLKNGGGLNTSNTLDLGTMVKADLAVDQLTGGNFVAGGLDWFIQSGGDTLHNKEVGEQIN